MYVLRSRTPHAHELSQSRLNDHDASATQVHGDPTSPGSIHSRGKSGGTRIQAKHSLLSQQLVALWNRQGLTLQDRQRQIGSSRVLTHATEEHVACLQQLIQTTDFSCQPRGGAKRPVSSQGHESLMQEAFRPIRETSTFAPTQQQQQQAAAPSSPYKSVVVRRDMATPLNAMQLTPIQQLDGYSPDRYGGGGGSRPVSRNLNYTSNTSLGYNDSASISGFTTPGVTPSKEKSAPTMTTTAMTTQQEALLRRHSTGSPQATLEGSSPYSAKPEVGRPKPNKGAWREYDEASTTVSTAAAAAAAAPLAASGSTNSSTANDNEPALKIDGNKVAQQLVAGEEVRRDMISDDALSQIDILYLTHCHAQLSIESQLLDQQQGGTGPSSSYGAAPPSFIYERTSNSVLLQGLPAEKIDRLLLLERSHRLKLERVALMGPAILWDLFIVGRTETTQRSLINREYNLWAEEMYDTFSGFLNKYLDAKPLYRLVFTAFYRVEQEENAAWVFLDDTQQRKRGIVARCQPVFTCEKEDRSLHEGMEAAEREELTCNYEEHFSVATHLQAAREDCELETINQDEDYVRSYHDAEEVYSRQLIQLQSVEGTIRHKMSELHSDKQSVLIKAEAVLAIVEDAKIQLRYLSEQTTISTGSQKERQLLELNEMMELRETSLRMVAMVEEATERCLIYLQLREARDRLQLQGLQDLEVVQMESDNLHRTMSHEEEALFNHIPHAVFLQCAAALEAEADLTCEKLFDDEQTAWFQIPVDLCVAQLKALEDHESIEREKIDVEEVVAIEETATEETGCGFVAGLGVQAMEEQVTLYACITIQNFIRRLLVRARRTERAKLDATEALRQESGLAASMVQRCLRIFKARVARRKTLEAEAAVREAEAEEQEQNHASSLMTDSSRKYVERRDAKKIVGARRHEKLQSDKLLEVTSLADVVHNEAHHRHDVMMQQITSYMSLSEKWLTERSRMKRKHKKKHGGGSSPSCSSSASSSLEVSPHRETAPANATADTPPPNSLPVDGEAEPEKSTETKSKLLSMHPEKENATRKLQGAGRHRRAINEVEERRSRSNSPAAAVTAEKEPLQNDDEKESATRRIQSAGRNRRAQDQTEERRSRSNSPARQQQADDQENLKDKESAALRIQSAGRSRRAMDDVEERRSRSNSPAQGVSTGGNEKEDATTRIQSAGRHRKAIRDVEERRSRSTSPVQPQPVEVTPPAPSEMEGAALRIQSASRSRRAQAEVQERRSRSNSPAAGERGN